MESIWLDEEPVLKTGNSEKSGLWVRIPHSLQKWCAQLRGRASDCGSEGRDFEIPRSPKIRGSIMACTYGGKANKK